MPGPISLSLLSVCTGSLFPHTCLLGGDNIKAGLDGPVLGGENIKAGLDGPGLGEDNIKAGLDGPGIAIGEGVKESLKGLNGLIIRPGGVGSLGEADDALSLTGES